MLCMGLYYTFSFSYKKTCLWRISRSTGSNYLSLSGMATAVVAVLMVVVVVMVAVSVSFVSTGSLLDILTSDGSFDLGRNTSA